MECIDAWHLWIFCYHVSFMLHLTYQTCSALTHYWCIDNNGKPLILHVPKGSDLGAARVCCVRSTSEEMSGPLSPDWIWHQICNDGECRGNSLGKRTHFRIQEKQPWSGYYHSIQKFAGRMPSAPKSGSARSYSLLLTSHWNLTSFTYE